MMTFGGGYHLGNIAAAWTEVLRALILPGGPL
jgi:hypothetical protein